MYKKFLCRFFFRYSAFYFPQYYLLLYNLLFLHYIEVFGVLPLCSHPQTFLAPELSWLKIWVSYIFKTIWNFSIGGYSESVIIPSFASISSLCFKDFFFLVKWYCNMLWACFFHSNSFPGLSSISFWYLTFLGLLAISPLSKQVYVTLGLFCI